MHRPLLPLVALVLLSGSAASPAEAGKPYHPPALPSAEEVAVYVGAHWSEEYGPTFAHFAGHDGAQSTLLRVEKVVCGYRFVTPECTFDVTGRFASGEEARQNICSQFDRKKSGSLESVIAISETRIRPR